ncbi:hypothetical protein AAMO2058_000396900 [Amorphochlora amoebiformis]
MASKRAGLGSIVALYVLSFAFITYAYNNFMRTPVNSLGSPMAALTRVAAIPSPAFGIHNRRCASVVPRMIVVGRRADTMALQLQRAEHVRVNAAATENEDSTENIEEKLMEAEDRMRKSITSLSNNLITVSTGRANPAMLDRVQVNYYGSPTPIRSLAGISTPNAQEIVVDPYDKTALADVERAIFQANLGLTPSNDGKVIRLNIPMLTQDRRKELAKSVKKFGEEAKVAIRNIRRDAIDFVKKTEKNKGCSEDDSKFYQSEAQKLTDKLSKEVDAMIGKKEKDLLSM